MGSGGIDRDLRNISRRSKRWERVYGPFPSVSDLGKGYIEAKQEEPKPPKSLLIDLGTIPETKKHKTEAR